MGLTAPSKNQSGIALFMVLAAISVLALLVTEFTYIAQVSQMIAYGGLEQTKAHYIAKSGLKISLLRLKAYQQAKALMSRQPGAASVVPRNLLDKIWSFPFIYPLPTDLPGLSITDKDALKKFQSESGLDGQFTAIIEAESSKYNLNLLLPGLVTSPSPTPSQTPTPGSSPSPLPLITSEAAQESLYKYLNNILIQKNQNDPDFATLYRDFRMEDFFDSLVGWVDRQHQPRSFSRSDKIPLKRAPFYSLSELRMVPNMDDDLYDLLSPNLSVQAPGINVNTMKESTLRALVPEMHPEEVKDFFKFRDSQEQDNSFKSKEDFLKYLQNGVAAFRNDQKQVQEFSKGLADRGIQLVTEETVFKITVQAHVNSATRTIEAWVVLDSKKQDSNGAGGAGNGGLSQTQPPGVPPFPGSGGSNNGNGSGRQNTNPSGLRIVFMKML